MLYPDLIDVPVEVFGGYTPAIPPQDLPPGASPFCQDVEFPLGAVRQRGGLKSYFPFASAFPNNAAINGLKTYSTPTLVKRLMVWDSLGNLYKENPQGTINLLAVRPQGAKSLYQSTTLFGREYQAFFNNFGGIDIPRQYDDTNWDRVSQVGPGAPPTATDETRVLNIAINAAFQATANLTSIFATNLIATITQVGNVCTVTATTGIFGFPLAVGDTISIAGNSIGAYNAVQTITQVVPGGLPGTTSSFQFLFASGTGNGNGGNITTSLYVMSFAFSIAPFSLVSGVSFTNAGLLPATYNGNFVIRYVQANAIWFNIPGQFAIANNTQGGTMTPTGNVIAGLHQISIVFLTRQGFLTYAAVPPGKWTATGNKRVFVTNIPTGPSNVVARLLLFTPVITPPAVTGSFFSLPNGNAQVAGSSMLINDNVTTTTVVDFTDTILIAGFNANYLFTQRELGECAFAGGYNSRTVWLGERNKVQNFINLTFDGGFSNTGIPLGWTPHQTFAVGASSAVGSGFTADWGDALAITGDGVTAVRGKLMQPAFQDYLGAAQIAQATSYQVRVRLAKAGGLNAGTFHINLQSTIGGFTTVGLAVNSGQLAASYAEFTANLTDLPLANPPIDLTLQIYADGTPNNNGVFLVDSIEIFAINAPFNYSTAWLSHAFNPESFDNTTSSIQVRPNDGQQLRAGFPIRNNYYLAKDHYLCYVTDDGQNEPASWAVNEVSATVGIAGPNACDWTEEWAAFAERSGVYLCWGSDPAKITTEIAEDASLTGKIAWSSINWAAGYTIWLRIDQVNRRIYIGAPVNNSVTPNVVFVLDYRWLDTAQDIANSPMVTYSAFTGKILAHGRGRRWTYWNIAAASMCLAERTDGTAQPFYGNAVGNGNLWQQVRCDLQPSDQLENAAGPINVAINSVYQFYFAPSGIEEQGLQLGSHRKLLGYIKWSIRGVGSLLLSIQTGNRVTNLRNYPLSTNPPSDSGRGINIHSERFSGTIGTNQVGSWWQAEKWVFCMKKAPTILVRGTNT